jgi:SAM-dependent methyltransferase
VSAGAALAPSTAAATGIVCPHCRGPLGEDAAGAACRTCARRYTRHHGILDLRVFPDPYLAPDEDRARAEHVLAAPDRLSMAERLEHYWSLSDSTPPRLRRSFVRSALRAAARARVLLARMADEGVPLARSRVLDIGSGTGAFLAEAQPQVAEVVGLDIALRWLHLGRRRPSAGGRAPAVVCGCAEQLPFEDGAFDVVVSTATLEFTRDPGRVLGECARVLRPGGRAYLATVNRFSLAPEPHVGLWGVGFLPRAWQAGYVRRRGRGDFEQVRLLSWRELDRLARPHFGHRRYDPPRMPEELGRDLGAPARAAVAVYEAAARVPILRGALRWVGPEWDVTLTRTG